MEEWERPGTPDVADVAESLQALQIEPSSRDLWVELKALREDLKTLKGRVQTLEEGFIPEDPLVHPY